MVVAEKKTFLKSHIINLICDISHFSHHSKCVTNIRGTGKKCLGRRGNPDHGKCDQSRFSVQRCFVENGHRCANAYFMPCSPGDPEGCPKNFV